MADTTFLDYVINSVSFLVTFSLIVLLFGTLLYFGVFIWRIKDKSEDYDKNFLLRSFLIAFLASFIVIFVEFVFVLLLFSPIFRSSLNPNIISSVMTTSITEIVLEIFVSPIHLLIMLLIMIIVMVSLISLVMLDLYKVHFGWTTVVAWTAIGIYLGVDLIFISIGFSDGIAGLFELLGDSIYNALS